MKVPHCAKVSQIKRNDFSITQILREMREVQRAVILSHLKALNLGLYEFLHFFEG